MSNEKLQEAVSLYNSGNKTQAAKLLGELVRQEPNNSLAWYGLALCLDETSKKIYCLKKVLELDPSNQKAQQLIVKLDAIKNSPDNRQPSRKKSGKRGIYAIIALLSLLFIGAIGIFIFFFNINSPEQKYSKEMEPTLIKLDKWLNGPVAQWEKILNSPYEAESGKVTNNEVFTMYVGIKDNGNFTNVIQTNEMRQKLAENLIPTAESISSDGFDILTNWGGVN
ncbi:MAG: hypothetical protein WA821_06190, partial [Anaerolineales bacterium]